jgi:hypothetical protein
VDPNKVPKERRGQQSLPFFGSLRILADYPPLKTYCVKSLKGFILEEIVLNYGIINRTAHVDVLYCKNINGWWALND